MSDGAVYLDYKSLSKNIGLCHVVPLRRVSYAFIENRGGLWGGGGGSELSGFPLDISFNVR